MEKSALIKRVDKRTFKKAEIMFTLKNNIGH